MQRDLDDLFRDLLRRELAILTKPAREPIDHAEEAESGGRRIHLLQPPFGFELIEEIAQAIKVFALALRDLSILGRRERRDLVYQDRDGTIASGHELCVAGDNKAQPRARISNGLCGR